MTEEERKIKEEQQVQMQVKQGISYLDRIEGHPQALNDYCEMLQRVARLCAQARIKGINPTAPKLGEPPSIYGYC